MRTILDERNTMLSIITQKPIFGYIGAAGGAVSGILTWLSIISPFIGIIGATFGAIAGFFVMCIKAKEWWSTDGLFAPTVKKLLNRLKPLR